MNDRRRPRIMAISMSTKQRISAVVLATALIGAACGDDNSAADMEAGGAIEMATRDGDSNGATDGGGGAVPAGEVARWDDVSTAVIRIETTGGLYDVSEMDITAVAGSGSGFFIDSSGLAVTNNHVVGGAATVEVYVEGESTPRNAIVVAASECSDLAVIRVDGGSVPYLGWADVPATPPDEVYAVGFPLGDPEVTVTDGVISKARSNGSSPFSSVDFEIEHTAFTNPGSSGGPLVTSAGRVVGVHYQSTSAGQFSAIGAEGAEPVVESLRLGQPVEWLGLNSIAVDDVGLLVIGVETNSPAGRAGFEPGDILDSLENLPVGVDGTKDGYCDVLRSRDDDAPLRASVIRVDGSRDDLLIERDGS
jgi:serine protease Do